MESQIVQPIMPPSVNPPEIAPAPVPFWVILALSFLVGAWCNEITLRVGDWWGDRQGRKRAEAEDLLQRCLEKSSKNQE